MATPLTPQQLAANAVCFDCIPNNMREPIRLYLLNQIFSNSVQGGTGSVLCGAVDPVADPSVTCAVYYNTVTSSWWYWDGAAWINKVSAATFMAAVGTAALPSYTFNGDLATGMFHPAVSQVGISTAGVQRTVVDGNGQFGIGTTTPQFLLHVKGVIGSPSGYALIDSIADADAGLLLRNNNVNGWQINNEGLAGTNDLRFFNYTLFSAAITIQASTNNFGIGTTAPKATLDFQGSLRGITVATAIARVLSLVDNTVYVTTGATVGMAITLPAASANTIGLFFFVYKVDAGVGTVAITPNGADTLNGVNATKLIANQWNGALIRGSSATGWLVTSFTGL